MKLWFPQNCCFLVTSHSGSIIALGFKIVSLQDVVLRTYNANQVIIKSPFQFRKVSANLLILPHQCLSTMSRFNLGALLQVRNQSSLIIPTNHSICFLQ